MKRLTEKSIIKRNPEIISHNFDGTVYLIDSQGQTARILNRTASFVWEKTKKQISVGSLIGLVTAEFEVSADRAGKEVLGFISRYANYGLIMLKQSQLRS